MCLFNINITCPALPQVREKSKKFKVRECWNFEKIQGIFHVLLVIIPRCLKLEKSLMSKSN